MTTTSLSLLAVLCYLASAVFIAKNSTASRAGGNSRPLLFPLLIIALGSHAALLYITNHGGPGFNFGIFNAASLIAFSIGALLAAILIWQPVNTLGVVVYPLAALFVAIAQWLPSERIVSEIPLLTRLHIALSIFSYSLLAIAALQAVYLAVAHNRLKSHRPILNFLPPLATMETILFQITAIAFALLTISLILGGFAIHDIEAQHLTHKIFFSVLAWLVFASLLIGRWRYHWRGHRAVKYVCVGFALLATGFFGSKLVLELILQRA